MNEAARRRQANEDAAKAVRFMAVKAAIFILVPVLATVIAVMITLK